MPFMDINGVSLHYLEQGSGPLHVVFGHGTLISSNIWRDFYFPRLPEDWHALAPDFRGHGSSNGVKTGCNFVQMADDIASMIRKKGFGKVTYTGLSMGGGVGLQLALRHPELLQGLVLISPVTGLGPLGNIAFTKLGKHMAGNRWLLRIGLRSVSSHKPAAEDLEKVVDEAMQVGPETLAEYLSPANRIAGVERLAWIDLPVLLLIGLKDRVIPVRQQLALGRMIPNCRVETHSGRGHALCAEEPGWVWDHLQSFCLNLPSGS
ncbi:MAG: alpha/beta hydrolase [Candidatus Cloacimonetes bacterium]|jgi:pimeloyl-ACP methyl ester carboxylesterase|nr:alpha/beta hydrolase [Candidatus Cloacimonadota bacterium]MDY0367900.1 alpha/beta hydrolase [Candidatus Syntrophosphaera sp.]